MPSTLPSPLQLPLSVSDYKQQMRVQFDSIIENMKIQNQACFLPLEVAIKYYQKWDCDITCQLEDSIYYKCLNGIGSVEFLNGNSYNGGFKNGFMHGNGLYKWKNGLVYEGDISMNTLTGEGKLRWPDGSFYTGSVKEGKRDGSGEYYCSIDQSNYKGTWKKGVKEGRGVLTFANGAVYEGEFKAGLRDGFGKMRYQSGNEYQGFWKQDKKEGKGVMNWYSTLQKYEGQWKDDAPSGLGSYYWFQGKGESKIIKTIFKGEWKCGKRQGFGTFYYNNGCKLQGTFCNNLKEGVCFLVDEFGEGHLETFRGDKSVLKKEQITMKVEKKHFKLPQIHQTKKSDIGNVTQNIPPSVLQINQPQQNNYPKFIDFQCSLIDQPIYNVLLRENSQLRQWYKALITTLNKQIFNGFSIDGLWRLVKDMRLTDQSITIAKLNRQFFKGYKSRFEVEFSSKNKLQTIKNNTSLLTPHNYCHIQWDIFFDEARKMKIDWSNRQDLVRQKKGDVQRLFLKKELNIHSNHHIILFRHFIVYIMHLTLLQHHQTSIANPSVTFRKCLEDIFHSIKLAVNPVSNFKTENNYSDNMTNVSHNQSKLHISEEYTAINHTLFEALCTGKQQLLNTIDHTVTVKQIYCLLCQCEFLKEPSEKMLFLEKIERNMNVKTSLLKKDNKIYYQALEKIILKSPHFVHILNYQMIESQFDEIMYVFLNRKIEKTQSKEQFLKKYRQIIKSILNVVNSHQKQVKNKPVQFNFKRYSQKDRQKDEFLKRLADQRQRKMQEQMKLKEMRREQRERMLMKRDDFDIKDEDISQESDEYYD